MRADDSRQEDDSRIDRLFSLNMGVFKLKYVMNFLMNYGTHLQVIAALLYGGYLVLNSQLEIGGVVAFISGVGRLTDPWGDLVNYFRDISLAQCEVQIAGDDDQSDRRAAWQQRRGERWSFALEQDRVSLIQADP